MADFYQEFSIKRNSSEFYLPMVCTCIGFYFVSGNYLIAILVALIFLLLIFLAYRYSYKKVIVRCKENKLSIIYIKETKTREYSIDLSQITCYEEKIVSGGLGYMIFRKQDNSEIKIDYSSVAYSDVRNAVVEILNNYNNIEKIFSF